MEYRFKTVPFKHQQTVFDLSHNKKFFALLMDMGTGKSKVLLDTAAWMFDSGHIDSLLIFANKGSYSNWVTEHIPIHMPDHITRKVFLWKGHSGRFEYEQGLKDITTVLFQGLKIFIMNIEAIAYPKSFAIAYNFVKAHKCMVVVDESTTIKNQDAKRTKSAIMLGRTAKATRIMTGSVVDNRPLDAYAQFEFLCHGCLGFTSYYSFRSQYAELAEMTTKNSPRAFKVIKGYKNTEDLKRRIEQHSFIIKKEDCLDLPPKVYQKFFVELTEEQQKAYMELKKLSMTEIQGEMVSVKIVLTKLLRLHQLVCGHMKDDTGVIHHVKSNRIDAMMEVIEETNGQVIIWANYVEDIKMISEALRKEYGNEAVITYYGDTSTEERDRAKHVFKDGNQTEGVRFFVGNPQTGGYGITLTGASTVIYYSNNFDAEKRNQSEDRAHRIGQTKTVTYVDLVARDTVDEKILEALSKKKSLSDEITSSNWKEFF